MRHDRIADLSRFSVAFFDDTLYDACLMTSDEARQIVRFLLAGKGIAVSPEAGEAELGHRALSADPLPDEICRALADVFDAIAAGAAEKNAADFFH